MNKKNLVFLNLLLVITVLMSACGGGSSGSSALEGKMKVNVSPASISTTIDGLPADVDLKISCGEDEFFRSECKGRKVIVSMGTYKNEFPLNLSLEGGESKTVKLTVFSQSDLLMPPFVYLADDNPSTSTTKWSAYNEVVGELRTDVIGKTTETCTTKELPPANPCPKDTEPASFSSDTSMRVRDTDTCSDLPQYETTCTPDRVYSLTLPRYAPGTIRLMEGTNSLEETSMGYLTGSGSGSISDGIAHVSLNYDPTKDSDIIAVYIAPLKSLEHMPYASNIQLTYGTLLLNQNGNVLVDGKGEPYASIDGTSIYLIKAAGNKNSPMVVSYSGEPYIASGGEFVAYGDGKTKIYRLCTKYAPVKTGTFSAFTPEQPGKVTSSNLATGEFTVEFDRAPRQDEQILVSYVLDQASTTIGITIVTSDGNRVFSIPIDVKR